MSDELIQLKAEGFDLAHVIASAQKRLADIKRRLAELEAQPKVEDGQS